MKNLGQMMKQAQEMQSKMSEMQDKLSELEVAGSSGGGLIEITMSGKHQVKALKIDESLVDKDDKEVLEDLIIAAINDATAKVDKAVNEKMSEVTGGLQLPPGLKLPF